MSRKKNNQIYIALVAIGALVLGLGIYFVFRDGTFDEINKKFKKIDESQNWYYMETIGSYDILTGENCKDDINDYVNKCNNVTKTVNISYPVINIDKEDIKVINEEYKNKVQDVYNYIERGCSKEGIRFTDVCNAVPYKMNDKYDFLCEDRNYTFDIKEIKDALVINSEYNIINCSHIDTTFESKVISLSTGNILTEEEVLNMYNITNEQFNSMKEELLGNIVSYQVDSEITLTISPFNEDNLFIYAKGVSNEYSRYLYDGTNIIPANQ